MAMTDPISDMLTRIRNGARAERVSISMPGSRIKVEIARVLKDEGYIVDYAVDNQSNKSKLTIKLKYYRGSSVIETIDRISKPGRRVYCGVDDLPSVKGNLGIAIVSTSKGVMTAKTAKASGVGGEIVCSVS